MKALLRIVSGVLLLVGLLTLSPNGVEAATVSIPSAAPPGGEILISGSGFAPYSAVVVRIRNAEGTQFDGFVDVSGEGNLSLEYLPDTAGSYTVTVVDEDGKTVGQGAFVSQ